MVKPIDSDSVVLIKENKKGEDAWSHWGGTDGLIKKLEKMGATIQEGRLSDKVTHVLMSEEFTTAEFVKGDNKGTLKHAEWIDKALSSHPDAEHVTEHALKKLIG